MGRNGKHDQRGVGASDKARATHSGSVPTFPVIEATFGDMWLRFTTLTLATSEGDETFELDYAMVERIRALCEEVSDIHLTGGRNRQSVFPHLVERHDVLPGLSATVTEEPLVGSGGQVELRTNVGSLILEPTTPVTVLRRIS